MPAEAKNVTPAWEEHGWMVPYLEMGDRHFGVGRLHWWLDGICRGKLPEGKIPQLEFQAGSSTAVREGVPVVQPARKRDKSPPLSAQGARKHLEDLVAKMGSGWESMLYLIRWLHWGLGLASNLNTAPESPYDSDWGDMLYRKFQLGRLQAADADVFGDILAERHGSGWNPNAFFATPQHMCTMMAKMTMADGFEREDPRLASVCDPCVGTGRMLLAASNYSLNLYGMDIDRTMVEACSINLALFAPWGVYIPRDIGILMGRRYDSDNNGDAIATMNKARIDQGHSDALPADEKIAFDKHGQGDLFNVFQAGNKKGKE